MPDKARIKTEKELAKMERKVDKIYSKAYKDISRSWNKFMDSHAPKLEKAYNDLQDAIKSGDKKAIDEAKAVYESTAKNITVNNQRFQGMVDETAEKLTHTNEVALAYVNGEMPKIYTTNYNAFGDENVKGYSFSLVNERAVKELATKDKALLPKKKIDVPKDMKWNEKNINSQMIQGILQGESIPKMAKRLMNVTDMNRNSAIRNARTMTTAAENKGRQDSYKKAQNDGVIMEREWVATHDERTREAHAELNGVRVGVDEAFDSEYGPIMYPGDPSADPANVYNCRCSIRVHVKGFKWNEEKPEKETKESSVEVDKNGLTLKEQGEILSYKSFDYYEINEVLREDGFDALTDTQKEKVEILDSALKKLPTYSGNVTRSLYFSDTDELNEYIDSLQKKGKLDSPAYLSTTKDTKEFYNPDGQIQIYIEDSRKGRDLKDYDNGEGEVLYERNAKIDIIDQGWKDGVYVVIAKERKRK